MLRHVMVLTRNVNASVGFWCGLGLSVVSHTPDVFAELAFPSSSTTLALKHATSESTLSTGYALQLVLDVQGLDAMLPAACSLGAHMDGPVKYTAYGKLASLRSPDGVIVGLFEKAS